MTPRPNEVWLIHHKSLGDFEAKVLSRATDDPIYVQVTSAPPSMSFMRRGVRYELDPGMVVWVNRRD